MSAWMPEPGERVVRVRNDRHGKHVIAAKVLRVGKRDIVLDDGCRFRVRDLRLEEGGAWDRVVQTLMRPGDPFVVELRAEIERANRALRAKKVAEDFAFNRGDVTAVDVIVACAPLTGLADELARVLEAGDGA